VQSALQVAEPTAVIGLGTAFLSAADGVLTASIVAGQGVVDALLTLDLRNIATALVDGTRLVLGSFVEGGHDIVDGIVPAQKTIADALSGTVASAKVTNVPKLSRKAAMVTLSPRNDAADTSGTTDTTKNADGTAAGRRPRTTPPLRTSRIVLN
jgi:hypothetical protein